MMKPNEQAQKYLIETVQMLEANDTDRFIFQYFSDRNYFMTLVQSIANIETLEKINALLKDKDETDLVKVAYIRQIIGG